jgi:peptidoglycan/xylan/chitin deacetylase (PgdA/CDA1 family)
MPAYMRGLRDFLPLWLRCALQEHTPGRPRRWRKLPGIEHVAPGGHAVLTFDDGPDPVAGETPAILDALDAAGAKATFFLVGEQITVAPDLALEIIARGHEVGVHGQRHLRNDRVSATESVADIEAGHAVLAETTGTAPRFYRPPYGRLTLAGAEACRRLGLEIAYWSTWGLDWEPVSAARIARRVLRDLEDGGIVLLHDSSRYAIRSSAMETARAIEAIATQAAARHLDLVTLAEARGAQVANTGSTA